MAAVADIESPQVRWDLSALFSGLEDPGIEKTWEETMERSKAFAEKYRGKINSADLTPETLRNALVEIESIAQDSSKPVGYAHLRFACESGNPEIGAFMQQQMERSTELSIVLMFFELELQAAPEELIAQLLEDPALANYKHYINVARSYAKFRLSEPEEIILEETANTGSRAWVRLYDELTSNHVYRLRRPGSEVEEEMSQPEVVALLRDPDRNVRVAAGDAFTKGLEEQEKVIVFIYNNLLQDKSVEDRLRKMSYAEQSRHLSNELSKETVDLVVDMCHSNYNLVERFYNVKKQILGLPELTHVDRYARLFEASERVAWDKGKELVLDAFGAFNSTVRAKAEEFFDKNWIDAEARKGKRGGAFCSYNTPDTHPVMFMSYLNKIDDVMTLAHELGHGVHASLSREQTYFNFHGTLPLAELASTFGEMLVFEKVVGTASLKDKVALYAGKIESVFATIFRQAALYRFEQRAHNARRAKGELTAEDFAEMWQEEIQAMHGNAVNIGDQHRSWWSYISHFFHVPFYVYAYSFGELLVLSLYQMAKQAGPEFGDRYVDLLRLGGSRTPQELMATEGIDLQSREFWQGGFNVLEGLVTEFESLWQEYSNT